jgi:hypothetical protein
MLEASASATDKVFDTRRVSKGTVTANDELARGFLTGRCNRG